MLGQIIQRLEPCKSYTICISSINGFTFFAVFLLFEADLVFFLGEGFVLALVFFPAFFAKLLPLSKN